MKKSLKEKIIINLPLVLVLSLLSLVSVSEAFLSSSFVSAEGVVDEISITVPVSCTMSGTGQDSHSSEIVNGIYDDDIGSTTVDVYCNDSNGFAIYATGYTGNEIGETNSNKLIGANTNTTIETGLATTAGNPDVSNWAMKLTKTQDSGDITGTNAFTIDSAPNTSSGAATPFTSYHVIPNEYTKVAHKDSATDMTESTGGAKFTTTYAAYISQDQPADTYSGQVIYTLVHPADEVPLQPRSCEAGKICYYPNGGNVVGTMGSHNVGSAVTLLASNFSREGYGFAGWNDQYDYSGNFYGPNQTVSLDAADYSVTGLSLYAVWVKSVGSLQDSAKVAELCGTGSGSLTQASATDSVTLASVSALTDQRDNETYAIAKLADGNCWMIENLRLEAEGTRGNANKALAQGYGVSSTYGNFSGLADAENAGFTNTYSANSLYSNDGSNNTINIGASDYPAYRMPRYNNLNTPASADGRPQDPTSNYYSNNNTLVGMYSYGNYYSWSAAMANTISYNGRTDTDANGKTSDDVGTSLCPSGWRLPYGHFAGNGATTGGFSYLDKQLGGTGNYQETNEASNRWRKFPNNFLLSGNFGSSGVDARGSIGRYWSSTSFNHSDSYYLVLSSSTVYPGNYVFNKYYGVSVRCVVLSN